MTNNAVTSGHDPVTPKPLYVFEAPVRIWHWTHALSIAVLCVTGYFIAYPLPSANSTAVVRSAATPSMVKRKYRETVSARGPPKYWA